MASISTTRWVSSAPYIKLTVSTSSTTNTSATYSYTLQYIATSAASTSSARSWTLTIGSLSKSGTYSINGKVGTYTITSGTTTISKTASSQTISYSCSMAMNLTWSGSYKGTVSASGTFTLARITYSTPSAPSSVAVTRVSDASQKLTWSGNVTSSTSTTYWAGIYVYRSVDGGSYSKLASLGNSVTSYSDTSTSSNHKYMYYLVSYNADATSSTSSKVTIYTTPATPTLSGTLSTYPKLTISAGTVARTGCYIYRSTDDGSYSLLATVSSSTSSTTYTDSSASSGHKYMYYVKAYNTTVTGSSSSTVTVYTAPGVTPSVTVTRSSDTSHKVTISGTSNSAWVKTYIDRKTDDGSWTNIATISASTTTYTDKTTSAGHKYQYGARAYNTNSTGSRGTASAIYTTPTAPTSVTASMEDDDSLTITVETTTGYVSTIRFQYNADSAGWTTDTSGSYTGSVSAGFTWTTDDVPSGSSVQYRVALGQASNTSSGTLYSSYTTSNSFTSVCAPSAPSVSVASSVLALGNSNRVSWTKNHPDGSVQTYAQVAFTRASDSSFAETYTVTGTTSYYDYTPEYEDTYYVRVRTEGVTSEGWGTWSSLLAFSVYEAPTVSITSPASDDDIETATPVTVTWEAVDETGIVAQTLTLLSASTALLTTSVDADTFTYELSSATFQLSSSTEYTVTVKVTGGSSLTASASRSFSTAWAGPVAPLGTVEYDYDMLSASLLSNEGASGWYYEVDGETLVCRSMSNASVDESTDDGILVLTEEAEVDEDEKLLSLAGWAVETVSMDVYRVNTDGTQTLLAEGVEDSESVIDYLPPLNTTYQYRMVGYADSGASTDTYVTAYLNSHGMEAYNFSSTAAVAFALGYSGSNSESSTQGGESYHFALGPDTPNLPTFYPSGDLDVTGTGSYVTRTREQYEALREAGRTADYAVGWFRSHWGARAFCKLDISTSYAASNGWQWTVTITRTETVWEEPIDG